MGQTVVRAAFRAQAKACRQLGSPFMARLCNLFAHRLHVDHGAVARTVLSWPGDASHKGDAVALRLCAALHGLLIEASEPVLQAVYPPRDSRIGDDALWQAVEAACAAHETFILDRLQRPPQTNEVRRAAMLQAGLIYLAGLTGGLPVIVSELGASAGLNLHLDKFSHRLGTVSSGTAQSAVHLAPRWKGRPIKAANVRILARAGCDLNPVDPDDEAGCNRMMSYIWPDQCQRIARTRAAVNIARAAPERVDTADAAVWLDDRLASRFSGAVHVVCHTIAWQYFPAAVQDHIRTNMAKAGARACEDAPLAWLSLEVDDQKPGALLSLTLWPGGTMAALARADFHGRWIDWRV